MEINNINYPTRMHRCKVIGRAVVVIVVNKNIAKSGDLGTWASCKHNKSVEFGEKLASLCPLHCTMHYACSCAPSSYSVGNDRR